MRTKKTKTIGRNETIEDHKINKKNGKYTEDRIKRRKEAHAASKLDRGIISTDMDSSQFKKLGLTSRLKINHLGLPKKVPDGSYDNKRYPHIAEVLCREYGFIGSQLAEVFGVGTTTIYKWVQIHPDFKVAVDRGREQFDTEKVEKSLLKRALGYQYTEKTERQIYLIGKKKHTDVEVAVPAKEIVTTTKELAPDVKAIMFWLQNRNPDRWKSVSYIQAQMNQHKTVTKVTVDADLQNMTVEQIKALRSVITGTMDNTQEQEQVGVSDEELGTIIFNAQQKMIGNDRDIEDYEWDFDKEDRYSSIEDED